MTAPREGPEFGVAAFRVKLMAAMALVVAALTLCALFLAERQVAAETQHDLQRAFEGELEMLRAVRGFRHASLIERCLALVHKPRIHSALEDNALDLLYPSARDELGKVLPWTDSGGDVSTGASTRARFYRFLDANGAVIPPLEPAEVGTLTPDEETRLGFASLPSEKQTGYLWRDGNGSEGELVEIIATPIVSTENGETIAALVAGFPEIPHDRKSDGFASGVWLAGRLYLPTLARSARTALDAEVARVVSVGGDAAMKGIFVNVEGAQHLVFCERLNPGSLFPPAYEVGVYPLADLLARQWSLRWQTIGAGMLLLSLGIAASFYVSARLAVPVRVLAAVSAENRVLRVRAEEALEVKSGELQRTARFSADASHQLKTPVAVLRAGLDELLARDDLSVEMREELSILVHQTFRLTSLIEDLLLVSRIDSGRFQLELAPMDLSYLIASCVDDLEVLHGLPVADVQTEVPPGLHILGEKRYTMLIVQNLVENARKYNRPGGQIRIALREENGAVVLTVANNARPIPRGSWEHIFERFHRGTAGENIPGHGIGLNLARELARIHGGEVRLLRSDDEWTEFEARFRHAQLLPAPTLEVV